MLMLMSDGLSNTEIAVRLFLSTNTVQTHAKNIFGVLNARSRAHAVAVALRRGLIT